MRRERFRIAIKTPIFVVIFAILALTCMAGVGSAVVYHGNEVISTDTTWSGDVHVINASSTVQVSDGVTLTISPGAVVKFESANADMAVVGTLNAAGTPANKIVFTSLKDDSYGGDTNNDGDGTTDETKDPDFIETNYAPTAAIITPETGSIYNASEPIEFNGTGRDPEDGILTNFSLVWYSDINGVIGAGERFSTANLSNGAHRITLMVNDSVDLSDKDSVMITVVNRTHPIIPPIANFTYTPLNPVVNKTLTFNASSSYDSDGGCITNYEWNFGDGNTTNTTEEPITHSYTSAGTYTVNLTVTDDEGANGTYTQPIFITRIQKGMSYAAWWYDTYTTNDSDRSLENLKDTCTEWVSLVVTWYQDNTSSTEIYRDGNRTPTDDSLIHAINKIHSLNMSVMLKPTVDLQDANWRGNIYFESEDDWTAWFSNYEQLILHYADLAEQNNVEQFCAGVEYKKTVQREGEWRNVIAKVREHYTGPITYASNWDNYQTINWWDAVDFAGIDAYFPLTEKTNPSIEELKAGWNKWETEIEAWQHTVNRQIIFTELGYCSLDGTNIEPWNWTYSNITDLQEQADCYNVAFQTFWNKPWLAGIYWWMWDTDPDSGGPLDRSHTPYKKPAESIVKKYYCEESMPDLVITDMWVCSENCTICYNITNIGNGPAHTGHNTTLFVDNVEAVFDHVVVALEPNESYTGCFDDYNWIYTPPDDNITVCADCNNTVAESNETNNCMINTWKCGDVDGNSIVNVLDVRLLMNHVNDPTGYPVEQWGGDVDGEGDINNLDVRLLMNHITNPTGYPLNCTC